MRRAQREQLRTPPRGSTSPTRCSGVGPLPRQRLPPARQRRHDACAVWPPSARPSRSSACRRSCGASPTSRAGSILVTGTAGSGKTTTLAAMIDHINSTREGHIVTIEDPIEVLHDDKKCIVNQREIGIDTESYADALRHVVRQDPDVILIGEMRDHETVVGGADRRRDRQPGPLDAAHDRRHRDHQPHHRLLPALPAEADPPHAGGDAARASSRCG